MAGPELLDLLAQTKLETHDLDTVYLFCALTFPLGNLLGELLGMKYISTYIIYVKL